MQDYLKRLDRALARRPMPIMCYATSVAALGAAALGALVNYALAEFMAVTGMLTISLLFLGLGLLHRNDVIEACQPEINAHREHRSTRAHRGSTSWAPRHSTAEGIRGSYESGLSDNVSEPVGAELY